MLRSPSPLLIALLLAPLLSPSPARAGLMRPVLELLRPQLEQRLNQVCLDGVSAGAPQLRAQLEQPCRQLALSSSRCVVEETDASGKGLEVMGDLVRQQLGPESERIAKRCLARLLGLPPASLEAIPLRPLGEKLLSGRR